MTRKWIERRTFEEMNADALTYDELNAWFA